MIFIWTSGEAKQKRAAAETADNEAAVWSRSGPHALLDVAITHKAGTRKRIFSHLDRITLLSNIVAKMNRPTHSGGPKRAGNHVRRHGLLATIRLVLLLFVFVAPLRSSLSAPVSGEIEGRGEISGSLRAPRKTSRIFEQIWLSRGSNQDPQGTP